MKRNFLSQLLAAGVLSVLGQSIAYAGPQRVYFSSIVDGQLYTVNSSGSNLNLLNTFAGPPLLISMEFDTETKQLYTAQFASGSGTISRFEANGSGPTVLVTMQFIPRDIAIDTVNNKLYYTVTTGDGGEIVQCNLDGSNCRTLLTTPDTNKTYVDIDVDPIGGKIYWAQLGDTISILKADLDGVGQVSIASPSSAEVDIPIALDAVNQKLYWSETTLGTLWQVNLDGSAPEMIRSGITIFDMAADTSTTPATLYFTEHQTVIGIGTFQFGQSALTTVINVSKGITVPTALAITPGEFLTPAVTIEEPPAVEVLVREVTLFFEAFDGVQSAGRSAARTGATAKAESEQSVRYDATITNIVNGKKRRIITANSKASVNLGPGTYTASYNAQIVEERSKAAKKKIVDKAKSKLATYKGVKQTASVANKIQALKAQIQLAPQKTLSQTNQSPETPPFQVL